MSHPSFGLETPIHRLRLSHVQPLRNTRVIPQLQPRLNMPYLLMGLGILRLPDHPYPATTPAPLDLKPTLDIPQHPSPYITTLPPSVPNDGEPMILYHHRSQLPWSPQYATITIRVTSPRPSQNRNRRPTDPRTTATCLIHIYKSAIKRPFPSHRDRRVLRVDTNPFRSRLVLPMRLASMHSGWQKKKQPDGRSRKRRIWNLRDS
jgi:hypothetical protein